MVLGGLEARSVMYVSLSELTVIGLDETVLVSSGNVTPGPSPMVILAALGLDVVDGNSLAHRS